MSALSAARSSSSEGCGGTYITAKPGHVRDGESSRGVSRIAGGADVVGTSCRGEGGRTTGGIVKSIPGGCRGSGDEGGLCGSGGDTTERSELVSYDVEGKAFNSIGARSVCVNGHFRNCGGSALCLEILRGCWIGVEKVCRVDDNVVRVGNGQRSRPSSRLVESSV